jgi:outer membrane protein
LRKITGKFFILWTLTGAGAVAAQTAPASPPAPARAVPSVQGTHGKTLLLSLDDALRIGSGESETVWVAEAGVTRAVGTEMTTRSALFPQLSGTAAYIRTLRSQYDGLFNATTTSTGGTGGTGGAGGTGGSVASLFQELPFGQPNQYSLGLNFSQLVFDGGQVLSRVRASESRRRSAEINADSARAEAMLDVASAYFDALLGDRLVAIAESSLAQQEEILRQTTVGNQVGDKSEFELLQSRVSRDNQVPVVIQNRNQRQVAYLHLKQLLNVPLADEVQLTTGIEELPARFATPADPSTDVRAPVRQAEEELAANQSLLAAAREERWPAISLSSAYNPVAYPSGLPTYGDFLTNWTVTLSLSIPIFTGGRLVGDELVARGNLSTARAQLQQTRKAADLDVETSRLNLANAQAILTSNESTVESAKRGYEIAQLRFHEGLSSQIELQNARLLFEQAEVNRSQALRNVQVARARLALIRDLPVTIAGAPAASGSATAASTAAPGTAGGAMSSSPAPVAPPTQPGGAPSPTAPAGTPGTVPGSPSGSQP